MWKLDLIKRSWSEIKYKGKLSPRSGCKSFSYNELFYFYGGYTKRGGDYYNHLYEFHPSTNVLRYIFILNQRDVPLRGISPPKVIDYTLNKNKEKVYLFGGCNGKREFNEIFKLNLETFKISTIETLGDSPSARYGHTAEIYKDTLYIFGGWNGCETLSDVFQFSFGTLYF